MINVFNTKYLTVINNILDAVMVGIGTERQAHTPTLIKTLADSFTLPSCYLVSQTAYQ